ncbi:MAG: hypothetical protein ACE37F_15065 [Nannocystaceae bacterium]|nr:hypothetical protein [bacterium]
MLLSLLNNPALGEQPGMSPDDRPEPIVRYRGIDSLLEKFEQEAQ